MLSMIPFVFTFFISFNNCQTSNCVITIFQHNHFSNDILLVVVADVKHLRTLEGSFLRVLASVLS